MRLCDVGAAIQEVMESYEVEINGKVFQGIVLTDNLSKTIQRTKIMSYCCRRACCFQILLFVFKLPIISQSACVRACTCIVFASPTGNWNIYGYKIWSCGF